ncbi:MAG: hypothetical protein ACI4P8_03360 [Akkermansia sp.]
MKRLIDWLTASATRKEWCWETLVTAGAAGLGGWCLPTVAAWVVAALLLSLWVLLCCRRLRSTGNRVEVFVFSVALLVGVPAFALSLGMPALSLAVPVAMLAIVPLSYVIMCACLPSVAK